MQFRCLFPVLAALALPACSGLPNVTSAITPYKIDVRQGNYVTQEMVAQLKPGMTKDQVRFVLGTPLLTDMFHAERWDYVYRFKPGRGEAQQRRLSVFFDDGKLARVAGDVTAAEPGGATSAAGEPAMAGRAREIDIGGPAGTQSPAAQAGSGPSEAK